MSGRETLVPEGTLTLPYGVLRTLHNGASEVRLYRDIVTGTRQVGKRVSLLGREGNVVHEAAFLREASHRNIAEIYGVAEPTGQEPILDVVEIMMPYYEAGSVFDAMVKQGERFKVGEVRNIGLRALRGLVHLHEHHRVLHRDLKPANLFLASDGSVVKIGDFGEAMRMESDGSCEPLASPQFWTPPETFTGERHTVASEVYSMGLTLHEMLSGPFPYEAYEVEALASRLTQGRPAIPPRHLRPQPHVPSAMRRIVNKASRVEEDRRFRSAHEMMEAVRTARFIDWGWPDLGEDSGEWLGWYQGADFRLRVRRLRGGAWRAHCERTYRAGWRQIPRCSPIDGADPLSAAEAMFSQVDRQVVRT